ncbi:MAG: TerB N-terminal domain-containing protein [Atopobiaceae bacterium]|nr:TerB N-terminal domain-containing protein [Atopobiaceae bacterium]
MANIDIDRIIEELLGNRRITEGAAFSSRTYDDQPLIERGSDLKARMEQRSTERAERHQREAEQRRLREQASALRRGVKQQGPTSTQFSFDVSTPIAEKNTSEQSVARTNNFRNYQPRKGRPTKRIGEMRELEKGGRPSRLAYGSSAMASLFYRQARLMEDYEDDYEGTCHFSQYFPTYALMSDHELRCYFSWRTRLRKGQVEAAPISFAYVYLYELICGIGTTPGEQGLRDMKAFGQAYSQANPEAGNHLAYYLQVWSRDYAIYHGLSDELANLSLGQTELPEAVLTLMSAEHIQLRKTGSEPRIENQAVSDTMPTAQELLQALGSAATYHICDSRMAKAEPELVAAVAQDVFAALVNHCAKRRKTDFVEGLFGYAARRYYAPFGSAVFFEEQPHPDTVVHVGKTETYTCTDGRWSHWLACVPTGRNRDLGTVLHTLDYELRQQLDYPYPLKKKPAPKYVEKMVRDAIATRLAERAEAERRRIVIDRSKLKGIRAAAALTQEALLTEEERAEEPNAVAVAEPVSAEAQSPEAHDVAVGAKSHGEKASPQPQAVTPDDIPGITSQIAHANADQTADNTATPAAESSLLSPLELRFIQGLMDGTPAAQLLGPTDPFVSVVADSINDRLFDLVGDAVIEFDDNGPVIVEDYLDDIREVLQA